MGKGDVFNRYAKYYDLIYLDKDYDKECDFIEKLLHQYSKKRIRRILELGCGTGGHAIPLAKRGYEIYGIELSSEMLNIADQKIKGMSLDIHLKQGDMSDFSIDEKFDAAICMFSTIDYINSLKGVKNAFKNIRKHLNKGSLFIFDFWNGFAVINNFYPQRIKKVEIGDMKIIRISKTELDELKQIAKVSFYVLVHKNNKIIDEFTEKHVVRFFFPEEIKYLLEDSGFKLIRLCPFMEPERDITVNDWNITVVARAD